ncbi:hypothetical protein K4F52_008437 [Lecanicillium sp. MT-2017a]|nr:hypothetical protein K4F52_008437 [Lecanicillium sp. MT-2017a]
MAPSDKALEDALVQGTCDVFDAQPEETSVNKVRRHVEEKLDLEENFLAEGDWKKKSKDIIKEYVGKLLDGWKPEPKPEKAKSASPTKKQKESKAAKPTQRRKSKAVESDQDDDQDEEPEPTPSASPERKRKRAADDDEESPKEEESDAGEKSAEENGSKPAAPIDEEEEYSDVIDIPPTPKRKKSKKDAAAKPAKSAKPSKPAAAKKTTEPDDPLEAEIKKLQSQLTKCGVRKLWHNELKSCGDDARAKIRHLKKMLSDIGMDGRFSEAKAREIKETRELLADAEAAQEMNKLWGMESGGRSSRNKGRAASKIVESDGSDAEEEENEAKQGDDDDEDEEVSFAARRRRAQADLAFLGDDSDSD